MIYVGNQQSVAEALLRLQANAIPADAAFRYCAPTIRPEKNLSVCIAG
jgi:hypothetical protein